MKSKALTVDAYLAELPAEKQAVLAPLREVIRRTAPAAAESMRYGMPTYTFGDMLCAMAVQKNYFAFYVCNDAIVDAHRASLAKLDIGKGCIRFKAAADLPLDIVRKMLTEAVNRRQGNSVKLLPKRPKRA